MFGLDLLGLGSKYWNIDDTIEAFPAGFALGFFDKNVFGNAIPNARKLLATGKVAAVRSHLWYEKIGAHHTICPLSVIKERAPIYEDLAKTFPNVPIYLSHTCEYEAATAAQLKERVSLIKKLAPSCIPVNCKWTGASLKGILEETHAIDSARKGHYIVSTDGQSAAAKFDATTFKKTHKNADIVFFWASRFNLREGDTPPEPMERKAYPNKEYMLGIAALSEKEGKAPTPTFKGKVIAIKKPLLYKHFAEDCDGENVRDNKPCAILSARTNELAVVTYDGSKIATFKLFPKSAGRYYSGLGSGKYGYQLANIAEVKSGNRFIWLYDAAKKIYYGPINPAFRRGYFK